MGLSNRVICREDRRAGLRQLGAPGGGLAQFLLTWRHFPRAWLLAAGLAAAATVTPAPSAGRATSTTATEHELTRELSTNQVEHSPYLAASNDTLICVWFRRSNNLRVVASTSVSGGGSWTHGGALPNHGTFYRVVGAPSVTSFGAAGFAAAAVYEDPSARTTIAVYRLGIEDSVLVAPSPEVVLPYAPIATPRHYAFPRLASDQEGGCLYLTYTYNRHRDFESPVREVEPYEDAAPVVLEASIVSFIRWDGANWSSPMELSGPACDWGRPIVGPDGEVYVVWMDYATSSMKGRRSDNYGVSFGPEFEIAPVNLNLTSFPGYLYDEGRFNLLYPCVPQIPYATGVAIDRSEGPMRGTLYVSWHERVAGVASGVTGSIGEIEPNDTPATATSVLIGQQFSGTSLSPDINGGNDFDNFAFSGAIGQTLWLEGELTPSTGCGFVPLYSSTDDELLSDGVISQALNPWPLIFTLPASGQLHTRFVSTGSSNLSYRLRVLELVPDGTGAALDHRDIVMTSSSDGGATWTPKVRVNDDPPRFDNAMPEIAVDKYGRIHAAWYDRRDDPERGMNYNVYWTVSEDGGVTFAPSMRVNETTNVISRALGTAAMLGDNLALVPVGDGVQVAWTQSKPQLTSTRNDHDIHTRRVDLPEPAVEPVDLAIDAVQNLVELRWNCAAPGLVSRFEVYRHAEANPDEELIGTIPGGVPHAPGLFRFRDPAVCPGESWTYRLRTIRADGMEFWSAPLVTRTPDAPPALVWDGARPNPFRNLVVLSLDVPARQLVEVRVYDVRGSLVCRLHEGELPVGTTPVTWDGRSDTGVMTPSGIYFIEALAGAERARIKVVRVEE